ncbi:MAG: SMI1/KNR4 family protein [Cyanobacteria bacterium P01_D01_bin.44]
MSTFDWESFLRQWSRDFIDSDTEVAQQLPDEVRKSGWLGYPGATEADISRTEARLGVRLPPSYRAFIKVTNGWRQTTPFIYEIWSIKEIEWFAARHSNWINQFKELPLASERTVLSQNGFDRPPPYPIVSDQDYFVYGDRQDPSKIRIDYLETALEISNRGESAVYLLNPEVISEDGEWEAWFFGDWLPGADRYRSFQDMMQAEYQNFLELRDVL